MRRRSLVGELAFGSAVAFAVYLGGTLLSFLAQLVLARLIGAAGYGVYAYVFAWVTLLAYLAALGFDVSLLRMVAAYESRREWGFLRGVIRYAERRSLAAGVSIAALGIAGTLLFGDRIPSNLARTFLFGFPVVPLLALMWVRGSSLRALGGIALSLAPDRLVRDGVLLLALGATGALALPIDAPFAMAATLAGAVAGLALATWALGRQKRRRVPASTPAYRPTEWRRVVAPLLAMAVSEVALNRTGVLVLGWVADTEQAGIFALAFSLTAVVALPRIAVNAAFAPKISSLHVRGEKAALQALIARTSLWSLAGAAAAGLVIAVAAAPFLTWFGRGFQEAIPLVWILLVGQMAVAAGGGQQFLMTMTANERDAAVILACCTAANAALTWGLIRWLGTPGAAVALTLALFGWQVAMAVFVRRRLGLWPGVMGSIRRIAPVATAIPQHYRG